MNNIEFVISYSHEFRLQVYLITSSWTNWLNIRIRNVCYHAVSRRVGCKSVNDQLRVLVQESLENCVKCGELYARNNKFRNDSADDEQTNWVMSEPVISSSRKGYRFTKAKATQFQLENVQLNLRESIISNTWNSLQNQTNFGVALRQHRSRKYSASAIAAMMFDSEVNCVANKKCSQTGKIVHEIGEDNASKKLRITDQELFYNFFRFDDVDVHRIASFKKVLENRQK